MRSTLTYGCVSYVCETLCSWPPRAQPAVVKMPCRSGQQGSPSGLRPPYGSSVTEVARMGFRWVNDGGHTVGLRDLAYGVYERRLAASLGADAIPRHVGVIVDGNRRWAREA